MKDLDFEINRICKFIKEHVSKTKSDGVVIALSGGLDSAVVAALSTIALGKDKVYSYFLKHNFNSLDIDKIHTDAFCKKFGLTYAENHFVSKYSKKSFYNQLMRQFTHNFNKIIINNEYLHLIFSNIDAKRRARFLYKKAKENNCLVLGTTNLSERKIGYFTRFDECGCDLQPILHLYKTEIIDLAKHLGIPNEIINKVPSANYRYAQTNEKGLNYQKLDEILIETDVNTQQFNKNDATEEEITTCMNLVKRTKHNHKDIFPPSLNYEGIYEQ
jgi:NAD+ synthase